MAAYVNLTGDGAPVESDGEEQSEPAARPVMLASFVSAGGPGARRRPGRCLSHSKIVGCSDAGQVRRMQPALSMRPSGELTGPTPTGGGLRSSPPPPKQ